MILDEIKAQERSSLLATDEDVAQELALRELETNAGRGNKP